MSSRLQQQQQQQQATWAPSLVVFERKQSGSNPFAAPSGSDWAELVTTTWLSALMGVALLLFFEVKRSRVSVFGPLVRDARLRSIFEEGFRRRPFVWALSAKRVSDDELAARVGLDSYFVLRFARLWRSLFFWQALTGTLLMTLYKVFGAERATGVDSLGVGNLFSEASHKRKKKETAWPFLLWLPLTTAYLWSGLVLFALEAEAKRYLAARKDYLVRGHRTWGQEDERDNLQARCSVFVERLPRKLAKDPRQLAHFFKSLVGENQVHSALLFDYDDEFDPKYKKLRDATAVSLVDAVEKKHQKKRCFSFSEEREIRRLKKRLDLLNQNLKKKTVKRTYDDFEETHENETKETSSVLVSLVKAAVCPGFYNKRRRKKKFTTTGVVTFTNPGVASEMRQLKLTSEPLGIVATLAVAPSDLVWANASANLDAIGFRKTVADVALFFGALALTPIVTGIQIISNLDEIARFAPTRLKLFYADSKSDFWSVTLRSLVTGYAPVVLLMGLFLLVPMVLSRTARNFIRLKSESEIQNFVLLRFFAFQMLAVYVTVLAGSVSATLREILERPSAVLGILGHAVPSIAPYFLQYLSIKVCFSLPFELARPLPFLNSEAVKKYKRILYKLRSKSSLEEEKNVSSSRKYDDLINITPPSLFFGAYVVPELLVVVAVGTLYTVIAPLVSVAAYLYFLFADLVYTRQLLCVYRPVPTDAGAKDLWPALVRCSVYALVVSQLATLSYLSILGAFYQSILLAPLPLLTHTFYASVLVPFFVEPAAELDKHTANTYRLFDVVPSVITHFDPLFYQHPNLKSPPPVFLDADAIVRSFSSRSMTADDHSLEDDSFESSSGGGGGAPPVERTSLLGAVASSPRGGHHQQGDVEVPPLRQRPSY